MEYPQQSVRYLLDLLTGKAEFDFLKAWRSALEVLTYLTEVVAPRSKSAPEFKLVTERGQSTKAKLVEGLEELEKLHEAKRRNKGLMSELASWVAPLLLKLMLQWISKR